MRADRRDLDLARHRHLVQRLDVVEDVLDAEFPDPDRALRQAEEHERVVGVRAVAEPEDARLESGIAHRAAQRTGRFRAPQRVDTLGVAAYDTAVLGYTWPTTRRGVPPA